MKVFLKTLIVICVLGSLSVMLFVLFNIYESINNHKYTGNNQGNLVIVREDSNGNTQYIYSNNEKVVEQTPNKTEEPSKVAPIDDAKLNEVFEKCTDDTILYKIPGIMSDNPDEIGGPCSEKRTHQLKVRDKVRECGKHIIKEVYCINCERVFGGKEFEMQVHHWSGWEMLAKSNCLTGGTRKRSCEICGEEETETKDSFKHEFGPWRVQKRQSCLETDMLVRECNCCDEIEQKPYGSSGHRAARWVITIEPTELGPGAAYIICDDCTTILGEILVYLEDVELYRTNQMPFEGTTIGLEDSTEAGTMEMLDGTEIIEMTDGAGIPYTDSTTSIQPVQDVTANGLNITDIITN